MTPNLERKNIENDPLHPFVTPENYFATFKERLKQRIEEEEKVQSEVKSQTRKLWKPYVYWSIGAAAVLLLAVSLWTLSPLQQSTLPDPVELNAYDMSDEEFQQFLLDDTNEDYWGFIYMEEDDQSVISSR